MFETIGKFEKALAEFTGAPFAIMTDCCTHALELCFRYDRVQSCLFTPFTYLSIPMLMHRLDIHYRYLEHAEQWTGEYQFYGTRIWDSARRLEPGMFKPGHIQCLSFGHGKPLQIGRGGAILLDDEEAYRKILRQRYDGRDLTVSPWVEQREFEVGYHYRPTIEEAQLGLALLQGVIDNPQPPKFVPYPDLRTIKIIGPK